MNRPFDIRRLLAMTACVAALAMAGCGSDDEGDPIPQASAQDLQNQLSSIERRLETDACTDIIEGEDTNVSRVDGTIDALPAEVDPDVRDALRESFNRLFELVQDECAGQETETETTPTETETVPTETETVPTETETIPTETVPEEDKPGKGPKDKDQDSGSGDPNGGGEIAPEGD
jgi:hypothetical protein